MASVHKRPRSPYFHFAFRGPDGRLILRSTKQTDRTKAMAVAMEHERASKLAMRGELTESQARNVIVDIMKRAGCDETLRTPTAAEFLREWMDSEASSVSPRTAERYRPIVEGFIESLGSKAARPVVAVTALDIQRYIDARRKGGCAPGTVQVDGKILSTAFNRGCRMGLIPSNPVSQIKLPNRESIERGVFTATEIGMLVDAAEGEWKALITIGYYTGQRLMDCARLEWGSVDFVSGTVGFKQQKTGTKVDVPLHEDLRHCLEGLASGDTSERFVLPSIAAQDGSGRNGLSGAFKRIAKRAGVDIQSVQGGGSRMLAKRTFHSLRHSFTSALANAGVAPEVRMKLTGHASAATHRGYTHHELESLRAAVGKLPSLAQKGAK